MTAPDDVTISEDVVEQARAESPLRGIKKMEYLRANVTIPDGHRIVEWKRDGEGNLVVVTEAIEQA